MFEKIKDIKENYKEKIEHLRNIISEFDISKYER